MPRWVVQRGDGAAPRHNSPKLAAAIDDPFLSPSSETTTARAYSAGTLFGATAALQRPPRSQHATGAKAIASDDTNTSSISTSPNYRALASSSALRLQRAHIVRSTPHGRRVPLSPIKRRVVPARRKRGDEGEDVESGPRRRRKTDEDADGGGDGESEGYGHAPEFEPKEDTHFAPFEEDVPSSQLAQEAERIEELPTLDENVLPWNENESKGPSAPHEATLPATNVVGDAEADAMVAAATEDEDRIGHPLEKRATTTTRDRRSSRATLPASTRRVPATPPHITSSVDDAFSRAAAALSSRRAANSAASASIRSLVFASFSRAAASVESRSRADASISASESRARAASIASLFSAAAETISSREGVTATGTSTLSSAASASAASSALASTATQTSFSITSTPLATSTSATVASSTSATSRPTAATSSSSNHRLRDILLPALLVPFGLLLLAVALLLCIKRRKSKNNAGGNESSWGGSGNDGAMAGAPPAAALMAATAAGAANSRSGSSSNNPSQDSFGTSPSAIGVAYSGVEPRSKWGRRSLTDVIAGGIRAAGVGGSNGSRGRGQVTSTASSFGGGRQPSMTGISDYDGTAIDYQPGQMRPVTTPSILSASVSESHPGTPVFQQRYDSPQHYDPFAPTIIPVAGAYAHRSSSADQGDYLGDDRYSFTSRDSRDDLDPFTRQDHYEHDATNTGDEVTQGVPPAVPWTEQAGLGYLATPVAQAPPFERAETVQTTRTAVTARTHQTGDSTDAYQTDMAPSGAESGIDDTSDEELLGTPTLIQQPVHFGSSGSSNGGSGNGSGSSRGSVGRTNAQERPSSSQSDRSNGTPRLGMGHGNAGGVRRGDGSWW
ncbi:BQ2448_536 [Microbotryum intermedium]|uniref:BQ2448_536 protein n=1 Tax=Microbotryum intermedium TaxID=269621 RepID=A0A238F5M6_9BASI|nr:BQ2448_536 [Microbotryum intermedium]